MPGRILTGQHIAPRHTIAVTGDSLSSNNTLAVQSDEFWPAQLKTLLTAQRARVQVRNFARSGNTTGPYSGSTALADMISRFAWMTTFDVPTIGIVFGGVNDPGNSIAGLVSSTVAASPAPTTTVFSVAPGLGASFGVGQAVYVAGVKSVIASKSTDAITVSPAFAAAPVAGAAVRSGTQPNIEYMAHQLEAAGCTRIIVVNTQYLNYSSGGDTLLTPFATYATLRPFQAAAVASPATAYTASVVLCDLYNMMRAIVNASATSNGTSNPFGSPYNQVTFPATGVTYTFGETTNTTPAAPEGYNWHVAATNQHLNRIGEYIIARCIYSTIVAQSGWLPAIT